jgi:transposase-like protein
MVHFQNKWGRIPWEASRRASGAGVVGSADRRRWWRQWRERGEGKRMGKKKGVTTETV